jgi:hypothetical protein
MKNILIVLLFIINNLAFSQELASLKKFKINGVVSHGDSKSMVISALGSPTKEAILYSEMDDINMIVLYYGKSEIYLKHDKVSSFEVNDSNLFLTYENNEIRIGQNISTIAKIFPESYNSRFTGSSNNSFSPAINLRLKDFFRAQELEIDEYISMQFSSSSSLITKIRHGSY